MHKSACTYYSGEIMFMIVAFIVAGIVTTFVNRGVILIFVFVTLSAAMTLFARFGNMLHIDKILTGSRKFLFGSSTLENDWSPCGISVMTAGGSLIYLAMILLGIVLCLVALVAGLIAVIATPVGVIMTIRCVVINIFTSRRTSTIGILVLTIGMSAVILTNAMMRVVYVYSGSIC